MKNSLSSLIRALTLLFISFFLISCASSMKKGDENSIVDFFEDFCVDTNKSKCSTRKRFEGIYYSEAPDFSIRPVLDLIDSRYGIIEEAYYKDIWRTGYLRNGRQLRYLLLVGDGYTVIEVKMQWWFHDGYWNGKSKVHFIVSYEGNKHSNNNRPLTSNILRKGSVNPDTSKMAAYLQRVAKSQGRRAAEYIDVDNAGRERRAREAKASRQAIQQGLMSGISKMNEPVIQGSSSQNFSNNSSHFTESNSSRNKNSKQGKRGPTCPPGSNTLGSGIGCLTTGPNVHAKTEAEACNHIKNNVAAYRSPPVNFCENFLTSGGQAFSLAVDKSSLRRSPCECSSNGSEWNCIVVQRYSCKEAPKASSGGSSSR